MRSCHRAVGVALSLACACGALALQQPPTEWEKLRELRDRCSGAPENNTACELFSFNEQPLDLSKLGQSKSNSKAQQSAVALVPPSVPDAVAKYRCVIVPGSGNTIDSTVGLTRSISLPDTSSFSRACSRFELANIDTVKNAWFDQELTKRLCDILTDGQPDNVIRNTAIVTLSMGGMSIGAALRSGACSIDKASTKVISVMNSDSNIRNVPSKFVAKMIDQMDKLRGDLGDSTIDKLMEVLIKLDENGVVGRVYRCGLRFSSCDNLPSDEELAAVDQAYSSVVDAAVCGVCNVARFNASVTYLGQLPSAHLEPATLNLTQFSQIWTARPNDGLVDVEGCAGINGGLPRFSLDLSATHALAEESHYLCSMPFITRCVSTPADLTADNAAVDPEWHMGQACFWLHKRFAELGGSSGGTP